MLANRWIEILSDDPFPHSDLIRSIATSMDIWRGTFTMCSEALPGAVNSRELYARLKEIIMALIEVGEYIRAAAAGTTVIRMLNEIIALIEQVQLLRALQI